MSGGLSFFLLLLLTVGSKAITPEGGGEKNCPSTETAASVGAVFYYSSRVGKEQKVAMDMAVQDLHHLNCSKQLALQLKDSHGNPARAISAGKFSNFNFLEICFCKNGCINKMIMGFGFFEITY
jgi:hypothetical protein